MPSANQPAAAQPRVLMFEQCGRAAPSESEETGSARGKPDTDVRSGGERLLEVCAEVFEVLDPHREAQEAVLDAEGLAVLQRD